MQANCFHSVRPPAQCGWDIWIKYTPCSEGVHNPGENRDTCINNSNSREVLVCGLLKVQRNARRTVRERGEGWGLQMKVSRENETPLGLLLMANAIFFGLLYIEYFLYLLILTITQWASRIWTKSWNTQLEYKKLEFIGFRGTWRKTAWSFPYEKHLDLWSLPAAGEYAQWLWIWAHKVDFLHTSQPVY